MKSGEVIALVLGLLAVLLYSSSWIFKFLHWPGAEILKFAALFPFLAGGLILLVGYTRRRNETEDWEE